MEVKINKLEQKIIERNIEINNVTNDELSACDIIEKIATSINAELHETDIDNAYKTKRKGKVIVEFSSLRKKREIMSKINKHRIEGGNINKCENNNNNYIYINDQLTDHNRRLLWLAKTKAKEANWKYVWVRNGNIYARKIENERYIAINKNTDIELIH